MNQHYKWMSYHCNGLLISKIFRSTIFLVLHPLFCGYRSMLTNSPFAVLSSENVVNEMVVETTPSTSECGSSMKVSIPLLILSSFLTGSQKSQVMSLVAILAS